MGRKLLLLALLGTVAHFAMAQDTQQSLSIPQIGGTFFPDQGCGFLVDNFDSASGILLLRNVGSDCPKYDVRYKQDPTHEGLFRLIGPDGNERPPGPFKCNLDNREMECYFAVELQIKSPREFSISTKNGQVDRYRLH